MKTDPDRHSTDTGKTFTRKLPVPKAWKQLGQVPIDIKPTEDGKYMTHFLTDLVQCDEPLENKAEKFFLFPIKTSWPSHNM